MRTEEVSKNTKQSYVLFLKVFRKFLLKTQNKRLNFQHQVGQGSSPETYFNLVYRESGCPLIRIRKTVKVNHNCKQFADILRAMPLRRTIDKLIYGKLNLLI